MLTQFDEDVKVLSQIPLTKGIVDQMKDTKMIDSIRCHIITYNYHIITYNDHNLITLNYI